MKLAGMTVSSRNRMGVWSLLIVVFKLVSAILVCICMIAFSY
jgi:hypothetical protein